MQIEGGGTFGSSGYFGRSHALLINQLIKIMKDFSAFHNFNFNSGFLKSVWFCVIDATFIKFMFLSTTTVHSFLLNRSTVKISSIVLPNSRRCLYLGRRKQKTYSVTKSIRKNLFSPQHHYKDI